MIRFRRLGGAAAACALLAATAPGCGGGEEVEPDADTGSGDQDSGTTADANTAVGPDCAPTRELAEDISEDTTLSPADGACLRVTGTLEVSAALAIEPGMVLKFAEDAGLNVQGGELSAAGTGDRPVIMTATEKVRGFWRGVQYRDTAGTGNALEHVVIEYAGGTAFQGAGSAALVLNSAGIDGEPIRVSIDDTTLRESASYGLYAETGATITSFEGNELTANADGAATIPPSAIASLSSNSSYAGNDDDSIDVSEQNLEDGDHAWPAVDVPYRVTGTIAIGGDAHVTIAPGANFAFESDVGLNVEGGKLTAAGSESDPIAFRGVEDIGAFWRGIQFRNTESADNRLENVVIANAAGGSFEGAGTAALMLNSSGINGDPVRVALDGVEIGQFAPEAAVYVEPDTALESCTALAGFAAGDVVGDGAADFTSTCGLDP